MVLSLAQISFFWNSSLVWGLMQIVQTPFKSMLEAFQETYNFEKVLHEMVLYLAQIIFFLK